MIRALLILCACAVVPGLCKLCFGLPPKFETSGKNQQAIKTVQVLTYYVANFLALLVQTTAMFVLVLSNFETEKSTSWLRNAAASPGPQPSVNDTLAADDTTLSTTLQATMEEDVRWDIMFRDRPEVQNNSPRWYAPVALFLLSLSWWETFTEKDLKIFAGKLIIPLKQWKGHMHQWRQKSTVITSAWSIMIILVFPFAFLGPFEYDMYVSSYKRKSNSQVARQFAPMITQMVSTAVGYFTACLACRLGMQRVAFSIPQLLATPVCIVILLLQCHYEFIPSFGSASPAGNSFDYFWHCPAFMDPGTSLEAMDFFSMGKQYWHILVGVGWWMSLMVLAGHIWWPRQHTLDKTEKYVCANVIHRAAGIMKIRHYRLFQSCLTLLSQVVCPSSLLLSFPGRVSAAKQTTT